MSSIPTPKLVAMMRRS